MMMLLIAMTSEVFVPYFLQTLHGVTPLDAGLISSLMAAGWSIGSLASAGAAPLASRVLMNCGPWAMALGLLVLAALMPLDGGAAVLIGVGTGLAGLGLGIGMCWPHLGTQVFRNAPERERDLASGSITIVIMVGNAFGSALGGMVTNMAGLTAPGGAAGAASAAAWLFGLFAVSPLVAWVAVRRSLARTAVPAA
jgi:predicted MFS family arabinose efflux permease